MQPEGCIQAGKVNEEFQESLWELVTSLQNETSRSSGEPEVSLDLIVAISTICPTRTNVIDCGVTVFECGIVACSTRARLHICQHFGVSERLPNSKVC